MKITDVRIKSVASEMGKTSNNARLQELEVINHSIQANNVELRRLIQEGKEEKHGLQL